MQPADSTPAIDDDEVEALFAPLENADSIALAVSGGADSLALLDCADRWRRDRAAIQLVVLTLDHRLRPESADEAAMVAGLAEARGLSSRILVWDGELPEVAIEAAARAARYRLLLNATRDAGASHLVLAHHRDDVAEGLLMRLARGSGVFGLAAMRPVIATPGVVIFRPFLTVAKSRLAATASAAGLVPVDDPMNHDLRFARARVRALLPALGEHGLAAGNLASAAHRLADAAEAIDAAATGLIDRAVIVDELAIVRLDHAVFAAAPKAVRYRVVGRVLMAVGGEPHEPRFDRLERLCGAISAGPAKWKRCLGGAVIERRAADVVLYREMTRAGLPEMPLAEASEREWDRRFRVAVTGPVPDNATLGPLGEAGRREISARGAAAAALAVLPAVWSGGSVRSVPSLGFTRGPPLPLEIRQIVAERLQRPPLFPDYFGAR